MSLESNPGSSGREVIALSELRLHRGSAREVGGERFDARRLRRIDLVDDRVAGWDAVVWCRPVGHWGQQTLEINGFQRLEGVEQAIACDIVVVQGLLQDSIG